MDGVISNYIEQDKKWHKNKWICYDDRIDHFDVSSLPHISCISSALGAVGDFRLFAHYDSLSSATKIFNWWKVVIGLYIYSVIWDLWKDFAKLNKRSQTNQSGDIYEIFLPTPDKFVLLDNSECEPFFLKDQINIFLSIHRDNCVISRNYVACIVVHRH